MCDHHSHSTCCTLTQRFIIYLAATCIAFCAPLNAQDAPIFSGPQPGEALTPFVARWAYGESVGKEFDIVSEADGGPIAIVFVHELTRPSIGLTRGLMDFARQREADKLSRAVVFLSDDATALEARLKRAQHALPDGLPIGISVDGNEGPGAYGLNRKVTLTVLVANENKVTANFALVQPSLTDAPDIGLAIEKLFGNDKKPTLEEMGASRPAMRGRMNRRGAQVNDGLFRSMIGPVIQKTASKEDVDTAAKKVEALAAKNPAFKQRVAEVTNRIIRAGRIATYGTPAAQEYLKKWSTEFVSNDSTTDRSASDQQDKKSKTESKTQSTDESNDKTNDDGSQSPNEVP